MKKLKLLAFIIAIISCSCSQKVVLDKGNYNYQVAGISTDGNGRLIVKSFATGRTYEEIKVNVLKKVIREIVFVGITNGNNAMFQKPIITDVRVETDKQDYFLKFYTSLLSTQDFVSISREFATKQEIKMLEKTQNLALGFEISVDRSRIKEKLMNEGIIKN
ncbi:hypothetical protein EZ428_02200 [Pedobacter frigiditerrae]|uniref:Lipoprotein n=1 Tax=Pedobacter frigiditerrae TaxID=2530452 RepID=A0A4R0N5S3_9SPHI|nr:hypothetical protein [Pedobacter frigiditerrae]TCC93604.1 hypothetical protein EZ428_02200 [Pedobacter frigiditerrae]